MNRSLLKKATKDDTSPTQGWMYHSIIKMTNQSDTVARRVRDWLYKRLKVDSPYVKKKVLLVIKNVCENGDAHFAITVSEDEAPLKEVTRYRGKKDELHGDAINNSVRKAAKEAIAAVYKRIEQRQRAPKIPTVTNPKPSTGRTSEKSNIFGGRYEGFGSTGSGSNQTDEVRFPSGGMSNRNMFMGISSGEEKCTKSKIKIAMGIKNTCQCSSCRGERASSRYGPGIGSNDDGKTLVDNEIDSPRGYGPGSRVGHMAGGDSMNRYIPPELITMEDTSSRRRKKKKSEDPQIVNSITEQRLITKLCGGTQSSRVSSTVLEKFVDNSFHVNGETVSILLEERLGDANWKIQYKALTGLQAVIKEENRSIIKYFKNQPESLEKCMETTHKPVKRKAATILKLLGKSVSFKDIDSPTSKNTFSRSSPQQSQSQKESGILDFFNEDESSKKATKNPEEFDAFSGGASSGNMFDGMDLEGDKKQKQMSKEQKLLSFFSSSGGAQKTPHSENIDLGMSPLESKVKERVMEDRRRSKNKILKNFDFDNMFATPPSKTAKPKIDHPMMPATTVRSPVMTNMNMHSSYPVSPTVHTASPVVQKSDNILDDGDLLLLQQPRTRMRVKKEKQMVKEPTKKDQFSLISEELLSTDNVFD